MHFAIIKVILDDFHSKLLEFAKECYAMKLDILTNATVVDDAIRFVSSNKEGKNSTINKFIDNDIHGFDKSDKVNTITTINQIF